MRRSILLSITALLLFLNHDNLYSQNSMTGDGFGGRGWYVAHNYQVGAYSAYTVCGDSNQLYGWGSNLNGELGIGIAPSTTTPIAVPGITSVKFYSTGYVSGAIKTNNTAWVWGGEFLSPPRQLLTNVKFVDGGKYHVVFVKYDGTVWAAGQNVYGELGNGTTSLTPLTTAVQMTGITNAVRAIAVGDAATNSASIILLADGSVKVTGGNGWFHAANSTIPVVVSGLSNVIDIKGNTYGAFALDSSGSVYAFGKDCSGGILGLGSGNCSYVSPAKITFPAGTAPIVALSSNNDGFSTMALDANHKVYAWGENNYGQIGYGQLSTQPTPVLVANNVIDIYAGETFSYILKTDHTLWATGRSGRDISFGSIWMNLPNIQRNTFTQINPTIPPMNLCAPEIHGVLPIQLLNFNCTVVGNATSLNWTSAEEINAGKYIVEYSTDDNNFQSISIINAKGSNSKYNYIHQQVSGTAFYRLKMIDRNGSFKYSEIRVVKFDNKSGFTIAPNPAKNIVYLFTKNNVAIKSIQILSVDGKLLKTVTDYNSGRQISISDLAKGTYILNAVFQNNETEYGRFIKM